jgi:hypothetical protein
MVSSRMGQPVDLYVFPHYFVSTPKPISPLLDSVTLYNYESCSLVTSTAYIHDKLSSNNYTDTFMRQSQIKLTYHLTQFNQPDGEVSDT